jgi:hypothetical protein
VGFDRPSSAWRCASVRAAGEDDGEDVDWHNNGHLPLLRWPCCPVPG